MAREISDQKEYVIILASDGSFRLPAKEGQEGAVKRDYETSDGKTGTKWEVVANALSGVITDIEFVEATFGRLLQITIKDDQGNLTISVGTNNNFATDFMKKLPNMDLTQEYRLAPYSFVDDKSKVRKGISITEGLEKSDKKVENYYYDGKTNINGFPEPKGDVEKFTKNKWKSYFGEVEDFLVERTKEKAF